jgi:hypothetical protein
MKARFCPGYDVARTCDGRCATCKHVILFATAPMVAGKQGDRE